MAHHLLPLIHFRKKVITCVFVSLTYLWWVCRSSWGIEWVSWICRSCPELGDQPSQWLWESWQSGGRRLLPRRRVYHNSACLQASATTEWTNILCFGTWEGWQKTAISVLKNCNLPGFIDYSHFCTYNLNFSPILHTAASRPTFQSHPTALTQITWARISHFHMTKCYIPGQTDC